MRLHDPGRGPAQDGGGGVRSLALPASAGTPPVGAPRVGAPPVGAAARPLVLELAGATGRAAWRARRPAAASSCAAAAVGTAMSLWASSALTTNVMGRQQLPLTVDDVDLQGGAGNLRLSGPLSDVPGRWGLALDDGYAVVDGLTPEGDRTVRLVHGRLAAGDRARLDAHLHDGDHLPPDLTPAAVAVDGPAGPCPAWRFDSDSSGTPSAWAIFVHGRGAHLTQGLRIVPTLRAAGLTTLIPSYRGDEGAPPAPRSGLGSHEWRDLEAAVEHAIEHGAERIVLVGYSMGAALITAFLRRSEQAASVVGVVLDSPVLDWGVVLRHVARARRVPAVLVPATMTVTALRARIDWRLLNAFDGEQVHRPPCLLFHGTRDELVPPTLSDALAEAWPDHVTYHRVEGAPHVAAYNVDPSGYEAALRRFLTGLGIAPQRSRPSGQPRDRHRTAATGAQPASSSAFSRR